MSEAVAVKGSLPRGAGPSATGDLFSLWPLRLFNSSPSCRGDIYKQFETHHVLNSTLHCLDSFICSLLDRWITQLSHFSAFCHLLPPSAANSINIMKSLSLSAHLHH